MFKIPWNNLGVFKPPAFENFWRFFSVSIFATLATMYVAKYAAIRFFPKEQEQIYEIIISLLLGASAGFVIECLLSMQEKKIRSLNELDNKLRSDHQSAELTKYYYELASRRFSAEIENEICNLKDAEHEFKGEFLPKSIDLAKHWADMVHVNERWRLLMQILLSSEFNSVKANDFSMPLRTYLRILLTSIDLAASIARSRKETLIVASFTNALPSDWFRETNPVVGYSMQDYAIELAKRIGEMKKNECRYIRHILCSDGLEKRGFKNRAEIEQDWTSCSEQDRKTYLSELHTSEEDAYVVELYPEIKFSGESGKFTELIYFGFEREARIKWDWCYLCAYTNDNKNVSSRFINLDKDISDQLIDVENTCHRHFSWSFAVPSNIKVSISDFPNYFKELGNTFKVKDLISLAKKWDIAAQIWHDEHEQELVRNLFQKILPKGATILDCGCGTGFHSFLLLKAGFAVTSTDSDGANIDILNDIKKKIGIQVKAQKVGWLDLPDSIQERFDCVACLGSSITYYESWDEKVHDLANQATFRDIIHSFKSMLKPNGILVIGISRHYVKGINEHSVSFKPKSIDGHTYSMEWVFRYDWSKRICKTWECKILEEPSGNDYSFSLVSHLIDRSELMNLCREFFSSVDCIDLDISFHDIFIICSDNATNRCS